MPNEMGQNYAKHQVFPHQWRLIANIPQPFFNKPFLYEGNFWISIIILSLRDCNFISFPFEEGRDGQKNAIGCNEKRKFLPQLSNFFAKKRHFLTNEQMTRGLDAHQSGSLSLQSGSLSEQGTGIIRCTGQNFIFILRKNCCVK